MQRLKRRICSTTRNSIPRLAGWDTYFETFGAANIKEAEPIDLTLKESGKSYELSLTETISCSSEYNPKVIVKVDGAQIKDKVIVKEVSNENGRKTVRFTLRCVLNEEELSGRGMISVLRSWNKVVPKIMKKKMQQKVLKPGIFSKLATWIRNVFRSRRSQIV